MPRIRGTNIVVDDFRFAARHQLYRNYIFFLSHFHADHYRGLSAAFDGNRIFCTAATGAMLSERFPTLADTVQPCEYNEEFELALGGGLSARVTFFDANHIVGSAMIRFRGEFGCVLYTGDLRFHDRLPTLWKGLFNSDGALLTPIDELVLDNTYCDPIFRFPSQERCVDIIREIIESARREANDALRVHIYCYTIGKEEICLDLARHFKTRCVLEPERLRMLRRVQYHPNFFTSNIDEGWIHLCSAVGCVPAPGDGCLHIHLSGWVNCPSYISLQSNQFLVAYSSHSNFAELDRFVGLVRPAVLTNIVVERGAEGGDQPAAGSYFFWLKNMPQKGFELLKQRYCDASRASEAYARLDEPARLAELYVRLGVERPRCEVNAALFRAENRQLCRGRELGAARRELQRKATEFVVAKRAAP